MELVRSRLGRDDDLAPAAASERRIVVAALQRELLDGIDAGCVQQGSVGTAVVDVGAVHGPVVRAGTRAIDRDLMCCC